VIECGRLERDLEFKKLKLTLPKNEYPDRIINQEMDKFVKNRTIREQQIQASEQPIEQQQNSRKTKKIYSSAKKDSAIQTHLQENPTHLFDPENIEILDKATSNFKMKLKEELHINTHKPELNSQHAAAYKRKHNKDMIKSNKKTLRISRSR